jgi:hypothetical protein
MAAIGERRGGRQRTTPNKRTVLTDRILVAASSNPIASGREILLILVKDQALPAATRIAIAQKSFGAGRLQFTDDRAGRPVAHDLSAIAPATDAHLDRAVNASRPWSTTDASPTLDVLLSVAQDATALPAERRKAASGAAEYFLPKKRNKKKSRRGKSRPDEYGFSVDPRVAKELRDSELQLASLTIGKRMRPYTFAQKARKLQARIKEIRQSLQCPCPSKYELKHLQRDKGRLEILADRRATGTVFTAEEDAEEAQRTARYNSFLEGPEIAARRRLADLRESKRAADHRYGPPLTPAQEAALRLLALLYPSPRPPKMDDSPLTEHPFADLEDFEEFVDAPPFVIGNPNYPPEERGPVCADLEDFEESADVPPFDGGNPNYPPGERGPDFRPNEKS